MNIPENLLYTKDHEWVRIEENLATAGITDYAQASLGDIVFVELPKVSELVEQSKHFATVESVKAASDVCAPVTGKILKINEDLLNSPGIINQSPYEKGWFTVIQIQGPIDKEKLMSASTYKKYVEGLSK